MRGYNRVILAGNVTRSPEVKSLPSGTDVAEWGMAMNRKWTGADGQAKEEVCFVDCALFGKGCEALMQYVTKGDPLLIEGRLKFDSWEDRQSGAKRSKLSIVVENYTFLGRGEQSEGNDSPAPRSIGEGVREKIARKPVPVAPFGDEQHFSPEDVPF